MEEQDIPEPTVAVEEQDLPEPTVAVEEQDIPELTVAEVAARLGQPGFHVYDNNGRGRWKRSHVPGAKVLDPYDFDRSELPEDTHATLVFYCSGPG